MIGLMAVNSHGLVLYWENILMGVQNSVQLGLPFLNGEILQVLKQISASCFLLATNLQIYKVDIRESYELEFVTLVKPKPLLSLLFSISQTAKDDTISILSFADSRHILVVSKVGVQKWAVSNNEDRFISEYNLKDLITKSVARDLSQDTSFSVLQVEIEDAAFSRENLICLCKVLLDKDQIYFVLVHLKLDSEPHILDKQQLSRCNPGLQEARSRIGVVEGGSILFVFFQNSIEIVSSIPGNSCLLKNRCCF
jgi:hypothetical protein